MHGLQDVGGMLVKLSPEVLSRIDMPDVLREAVKDAQRFTKHEAKRRQLQYIGRIMRDIDAGPIIEQLNAIEAPSRKQTAIFHVAEKWRQALLENPDSVAAFVKEFPEADPHRLRALAADAIEERKTDRPPRHFRELFHVLNAILQDRSRKQ